MAAGDFIRSLTAKQQAARARSEMVMPDPKLGFPPNTPVTLEEAQYRAKLLRRAVYEDNRRSSSANKKSLTSSETQMPYDDMTGQWLRGGGTEPDIDASEAYGYHVVTTEDLQTEQRTSVDIEIQKRLKLYADVTGDNFPLPPTEPRPRDTSGPRTWDTLRQDDIRKNFLWREWQERIREEDPDSIEYDSWNEMVAGEAMLRLIAFFPKGRELLQTNFYRDHDKETVPTVEQVTRFIEDYHLFEGGDVAFGGGRFAVEETQLGSEGFLSLLYEAVPYSRRCIARILAGYRRLVVRSWAKEDAPAGSGEVPYANDPSYGAAQLVTWDGLVQALGHTEPGQDEKQERLENFVIGLYSQGMNRDEVLKRSGISRRQLYDILEKRGVPTRRKARKKQEATA